MRPPTLWVRVCALAACAVGAPGQTVDRAAVNELRKLAESKMATGASAEALALYNDVIASEPKNERNFFKRCKAHLSQRNYKAAIADLTTALALKPKYKQALGQRAKLYRLLGQCNESLADYHSLEAMDPAYSELAQVRPPADAPCHANY